MQKADREGRHQREARGHRAVPLPPWRRAAGGERHGLWGRIAFRCGRIGILLRSSRALCRRFFQDVRVHSLPRAVLRLDRVKGFFHFVFAHAPSPPKVSFSFARASRS